MQSAPANISCRTASVIAVIARPRTPKTHLVVYHGTQLSQLASIQRSGLTSPIGYSRPKWYMVADDFASAAFHSHPDAPVVLTLRFAIDRSHNGKIMWSGYPYLWPPQHTDWNGKPTNWYALRRAIPARSIVEVRELTKNEWTKYHE